MTGVDYPLHRAHAWLALTAMTGFSLLFATVGLLLSDWGWRIACLAVGVLAALSIIHIARMLTDKRPVLRIAPDGLFSTLFANRVVPWSEITEIARMTYFNQSVFMGRVNWKRMPTHDQLHFAVADERLFPNGPGRRLSRALQRMGVLPPIALQLWFVAGDADAIFAEIAKHWTGEIRQVDPRPRHLI